MLVSLVGLCMISGCKICSLLVTVPQVSCLKSYAQIFNFQLLTVTRNAFQPHFEMCSQHIFKSSVILKERKTLPNYVISLSEQFFF